MLPHNAAAQAATDPRTMETDRIFGELAEAVRPYCPDGKYAQHEQVVFACGYSHLVRVPELISMATQSMVGAACFLATEHQSRGIDPIMPYSLPQAAGYNPVKRVCHAILRLIYADVKAIRALSPRNRASLMEGTVYLYALLTAQYGAPLNLGSIDKWLVNRGMKDLTANALHEDMHGGGMADDKKPVIYLGRES